MRKRDEVNVSTDGYRRGANFKITKEAYARACESDISLSFLTKDTIRMLKDLYGGYKEDDKTFIKQLALSSGLTQKQVMSEWMVFYLELIRPPGQTPIDEVVVDREPEIRRTSTLGGRKVHSHA